MRRLLRNSYYIFAWKKNQYVRSTAYANYCCWIPIGFYLSLQIWVENASRLCVRYFTTYYIQIEHFRGFNCTHFSIILPLLFSWLITRWIYWIVSKCDGQICYIGTKLNINLNTCHFSPPQRSYHVIYCSYMRKILVFLNESVMNNKCSIFIMCRSRRV